MVFRRPAFGHERIRNADRIGLHMNEVLPYRGAIEPRRQPNLVYWPLVLLAAGALAGVSIGASIMTGVW